jgi:deoxycytidine triphosphate deaminase
MLLSGKQIIERNIMDSVGPKSVREASYDLRVGIIIAKPSDSTSPLTKEGKPSIISAEEYELPPQGMVEVISLEKVTVPSDVLGYATVKTSLSDKCVLAIGIGLIDPGYDSYISSTLVNFGTQSFHLKRENIFLRTTFHKYEYSGPEIKGGHESLDEYSQAKRDKVLTRYSRTFLNLESTVDEALSLAWRKFWPRVVEVSALAALVVTITTTAIAIGIGMWGSRFISAPDSQIQELHSNYQKLQDQNAKLQDQYAVTEKELQELRQTQQELKRLIESQHPKK